MFRLLEEQEINLLGERGRTCHPFFWERELGPCVWKILSGSLQRGALIAQSKDLSWSKWTICLFVAGEQGGMGTKGNINALLLLGELATGDAHPAAPEY